jgi:uncharacterized protein (TIGR02145 family)
MRNLYNSFLKFLLITGFLYGLNSCKKETLDPPVLTTSEITSLSYTSAVSGGDITSEGGAPVTSRGVCWNTSGSPTIADSKTIEGGGEGIFVSHITQLSPGTRYFLRAYATNSGGTDYGNELSFTTSQVQIPVVTTTLISNITQSSVLSGGNVTSENGGTIIAKGVCWATSVNPTVADNKTNEGAGIGTFNSTLANLASNTIYYARAYATNSAGTGYGNEVSFILWLNVPGPTVADADGNSYNSVKAGTQVWMTSNIKTKKFSNGDMIGTTTNPTLDITSESAPKYQWAYGGNESNAATYGRLYTWYAVSDSRNICPTGWHAPGDADWTILINYLGGEIAAGMKMKETGTLHWVTPNMGASNESGFLALPGGSREGNGTFSFLGTNGGFWSSTENGGDVAWFRFLFYDSGIVSRGYFNKNFGYSVRCVKNN